MASITSIIIKKQFQSKFQFDKITKVVFIADKLKDQLILIGYGFTKESVNEIKREQPILKLSEHPNEEKMFMMYLGKIEAKELHKTETTINFETEKMSSSIFFVNRDNEKKQKLIETKF